MRDDVVTVVCVGRCRRGSLVPSRHQPVHSVTTTHSGVTLDSVEVRRRFIVPDHPALRYTDTSN